MMRCPPTHRGRIIQNVIVVLEEFCNDCAVDVYLKQVVEGENRRFAKASYRQVEQTVSFDGKELLGGTISLPNLVIRRNSAAIARRLVNPDFLPLVKAAPGPERYCDFENRRLAIRELFHGSRRISLTTRSQIIDRQPGSVVVAERPRQDLLIACRAKVGNGVKRTS
ncbi:hypothetical protein RF11_10521 [Thelohanellus kitauei]|uniref:Uncharacterized protein n=1 Tax=Thelohanellus kitauei TaxID=669202 RepID=A0A0C2IV15_THEKT|nr:hypothetical protein RF11_10521 [Thelohanellus kitauei]